MYQAIGRVEEINRVASRLNRTEEGVFHRVSLDMPRLDPAELGFIRFVSWLFILYHEAGNVGVAVLEERFAVYDLDSAGELKNHRTRLRDLRTFLQHNLDPRKKHDRTLQETCEEWFKNQCSTPVPGNDSHWKSCLIGLLKEALDYLQGLLEAVRCVEADESREEICRQWKFRIERQHEPQEFDDLISRVANDMGRESIDPVRLRSRFFERWMQELNFLQADYHFDTEARKLIEHALLTETIPVLPITGQDIMDEFEIPPGPLIGRLLAEARRIYDLKSCSRDDLLRELRRHIPGRETANSSDR